MGFPTVRILSVAFGVLSLILVTTCCAIPSWIVVSFKASHFETPTMTESFQGGLWKVCRGIAEYQMCIEYTSVQSSASVLHGIRAMTVISCLLTYLGVLVLLLLGFGANFIPFMQNDETKPKIRLAVGVGLLLAGILLIISVCWFSQGVKETLRDNPYPFSPQSSFEISKGAGFFVGLVAGVLLILGGVLLCFFRKRDIP